MSNILVKKTEHKFIGNSYWKTLHICDITLSDFLPGFRFFVMFIRYVSDVQGSVTNQLIHCIDCNGISAGQF